MEPADISILGAAFCKGKLCSGTNLSPKASLLGNATLAYFSPSPWLPLWPRRIWAASGSVSTAAWLQVSAAWIQLETCSPLGRRLIWHEKALFAQAQSTHPDPAWEEPNDGLSPKRHKTRFWKLKFCKGNLCLGNKPHPQCVFAQEGSAWQSHLALCSP